MGLGNLFRKGTKMMSEAWKVGEGEYKRLTNKKALVAFAAVGYKIGCSDYDAAEHATLDDAYDAEERESTLNLIETNPSTESFDHSDIAEAFVEAQKLYTPPVPKMPGHATKKMGDDKVQNLLASFAGSENAEPLMEAACMLTWGDGKIVQGEVDALNEVGSALGFNGSTVQSFMDKFAISVTG